LAGFVTGLFLLNLVEAYVSLVFFIAELGCWVAFSDDSKSRSFAVRLGYVQTFPYWLAFVDIKKHFALFGI